MLLFCKRAAKKLKQVDSKFIVSKKPIKITFNLNFDLKPSKNYDSAKLNANNIKKMCLFMIENT